MFSEIACAFGILAVVGVIGLPGALWLSRESGGRLPGFPALALSPALGIAVAALVAAPAYMFVGPAEVWAWPMLLILIGVSAFAIGAMKTRPSLRGRYPELASLSSIVVVVGLCLLAPAFSGGINRVVFNSNPSDSFMYMTLAESARTATFEQLRAYAHAGPELVRENPLALYSARFVGVIMRLTTFVNLGWISQVSGIGVERLLWPFAFVAGMATGLASWAAARILGLSALLSALAAVAIAVGFWGAMPREGDAYSNLQSMPVLLALVAVRIWDARGKKPDFCLSVVVGLLLAAFAQIYTELTLLVVGVLLAEAIARLLLERRPGLALTPLATALAVALVALAVTGQLGYLATITANQLRNISVGAGGSFIYEGEVRSGLVAALAGFPWLPAVLTGVGAPAALASGVAQALGAVTIACAVSVGVWVVSRQEARYALVVTAGAAGGVLLAAIALLARGDLYIFQKAMTHAAPFSVLLLGLSPLINLRWLPPSATALVGAALLTAQLGFPIMTLARDASGRAPPYTERVRAGRNYDLTELKQYLDDVRPRGLLVNVPPAGDWWWAAYVSLSLSRYDPYYQSGHFFNNAPKTIVLPALTPRSAPRYAVVAASDDYIGREKLGVLIVVSGQLRMYEITATQSASFAPRASD
jgi:hypothetical protein